MTASAVFSNSIPLSTGEGSPQFQSSPGSSVQEGSAEPSAESSAESSACHSACHSAGRPTPVVAVEPLSAEEVYGLLLEKRAAVHAELRDLAASGAVVAVPFDVVFLCELAGLVLDLETGLVAGLAGDYLAAVPGLGTRLAEQGFVCGASAVQA